MSLDPNVSTLVTRLREKSTLLGEMALEATDKNERLRLLAKADGVKLANGFLDEAIREGHFEVPDVCQNCGNDEPTEGMPFCSDCLECLP